MLSKEKNPVYKYRKNHKLTIKEFIKNSSLSRSEVSRVENGTPKTLRFHVMKGLGETLNVDMFEITKAYYLWKHLDQEYDIKELN